MKTIIAIEKINITSLLNNRITEVNERDLIKNQERQKRIEILTPFVAQALFGMVEIHNSLLNNTKTGILGEEIIENASEFVNEAINNKDNWKEDNDISKNTYTNVTFKGLTLLMWLSDNIGCMRYSTNPVYQIYIGHFNNPNNVEEFLKGLINSKFN